MNKKQLYISKVLTIFMLTCCMSFILSFINLGLNEQLIRAWVRLWPIAFSVAMPLSIVIPFATNKIVKRYIK